MKYKIGDLVRIKTVEEMEEEYGRDTDGNIDYKPTFTLKKENELNRRFPDRVVEIKTTKIKETIDINGARSIKISYYMKNLIYSYSDYMIKEKVVYEPILSRFDILDIR